MKRVTLGYDSYGTPYFQVVGLSSIEHDDDAKAEKSKLHEEIRQTFQNAINETYPQLELVDEI